MGLSQRPFLPDFSSRSVSANLEGQRMAKPNGCGSPYWRHDRAKQGKRMRIFSNTLVARSISDGNSKGPGLEVHDPDRLSHVCLEHYRIDALHLTITFADKRSMQ
jgi:hypothetical protein